MVIKDITLRVHYNLRSIIIEILFLIFNLTHSEMDQMHFMEYIFLSVMQGKISILLKLGVI